MRYSGVGRAGPGWRPWSADAALAGRRPIDRTLARLRSRAEAAFVIVALFLFANALLPLLLETATDSPSLAEGSPLLRSTFLALQVIAALLVLARWKAFLRIAGNHKLTLLLVALALVSAAWSIEPGITLRRGFALLGTTIFGLYLSARYPVETLLRLLACALGIVLVLSVVFALALPHLGVHAGFHDGAWRGVMSHKNSLGPISALATIIFFLVWRSSHRHHMVAFVGLLLAGGLLLLSRSATSLVILCVLAALLPLYAMLRSPLTLMVPVLIGAVLTGGVVASAFLANREAAFAALDRDPSLTGRTDIWLGVGEAVQRRPWLGYGYRAFWRDRERTAEEIWQAVRWKPTTAHNGLLELSLDVGLIGSALFLAGFATAIWLAVRAVRTHPEVTSLWPLMFLTFLFLFNITESAILQANSLLWILYVATVTSPLLGGARASSGREPVETAGQVRGARLGPVPQFRPAPGRCSRARLAHPVQLAALSPGVRHRLRSGAGFHRRTPFDRGRD